MSAQPQPRRPLWRELAVWGWLALFLGVFFAQELPNAHLERTDVARQLPFELLDVLDPPVTPESAPRGWRYLPQRGPLWGAAALIAAGAWGLGTLVLRFGPTLELDRWERLYFRGMVGLSALSLVTLGLGLCGWLSTPVFVTVLVVAFVAGLAVSWTMREGEAPAEPQSANSAARAQRLGGSLALPFTKQASSRSAWWLLAAAPFLVAMLFGSLTPSADFDVNEYHLGGPKEWFQLGRITFLEHNIYTSFPFLTEMLLLAGMVVLQDWMWGGVAGQAVLMLFAPLTALGLWNAGRRWWSPTVGNFAALIYLSTPWIYRTSIIAYAEGGLTAYLFAAGYAALWRVEKLRTATGDVRPREANALLILTGLLAGSAMACKYTGLVMVVLPLGGWLFWQSFRRVDKDETQPSVAGRTLRMSLGTLLLFFAGVGCAIGPWLVKNTVETGNPVYPLGYSVFGGRDLDDAWAAQWSRGHSRALGGPFTARDFVAKAFDVAVKNDWQSPLIFALAPLAFLWRGDRRAVLAVALLLSWVFLTWWGLTHHIDRFWVPLLPLGALLAGCGAVWTDRPWSRRLTHAVIAGCCVFNLAFCATGMGGYNAGLTDLDYARSLATRITVPEIAALNAGFRSGELPADLKVLFVGEAQHYYAEFPYLYNTVFDRSLLEQWCAARSGNQFTTALRDPAEIRATFAAHGITHVLVNWSEILRYRTNSYGYTDFVHPARFAALQQAGLLGQPLTLPGPPSRRKWENFSAGEQAYITKWAEELIVPCGDDRCFVTTQIFPVLRTP